MTQSDPEIGKTVIAAGLKTNYLEAGQGDPVILMHGSGPGVTAYANWRFTIEPLAQKYRVLAPDIAGFGYTERKSDQEYSLDFWVRHLTEWMEAVGVKKARFIGNSFGGSLTLAIASRYPERVESFVLMGAAGVEFELTPELDAIWGYEPSIENMRKIVMSFAYDTSMMTDDLVRSRYEASVRPGYHESFSKMFEVPRQRHIKALGQISVRNPVSQHKHLIGGQFHAVCSTLSRKGLAAIEQGNVLFSGHAVVGFVGQQNAQLFEAFANGRNGLREMQVTLGVSAQCLRVRGCIERVNAAAWKHISAWGKTGCE